MNEPVLSKQTRMELLHQLFASATHDASAAMCRWTNGLISLSFDEVREIPLENILSELDLGDDLLTMVVLTLKSNIGGDMILTFDQSNGRSLAATLLGRPVSTDAEWTELEKSAITETGNILGCAYMNALSRLISAELVPSPPYFIQDYGASVLQQALMGQAMTTDDILICQTSFRRESEALDWSVFFVPTQAMREAMEDAMHSVRKS